MATVICIGNHKGGVGKTTVTANLGALLSQMGKYGFNPWNNRNMTNIRTIDGMNAFEISKAISEIRKSEDPTKIGTGK